MACAAQGGALFLVERVMLLIFTCRDVDAGGDLYHYTQCGLANVWLDNGVARERSGDGTTLTIANRDDLHAAIAEQIRKRPLSRDEALFLATTVGIVRTGSWQIVHVH